MLTSLLDDVPMISRLALVQQSTPILFLSFRLLRALTPCLISRAYFCAFLSRARFR